MSFEGVVPILYSTDVKRSIAYYMEQLALMKNGNGIMSQLLLAA